ncbi:TrkH family potassium uptake protein [Candidatus Avelusimicrobium luingense]|uniref:TrkH family potassium uptake protein n=1 Tax=Candidatus Avelusimicrobium luingense TaxID=3416211 RepID=UPI003D0C49C8
MNRKEFWTKTQEFIKLTLHKYSVFLLHLTPHQNIAQTVLSYTLLGTILLALPFMTTTKVSLLDKLFTAAAAVSTAGLQTVNFADSFSFLGKLVVLILIQIGGIGYMTFSSFVYLSFSQRHKLRHRQQEKLSAEISLPKNLELTSFLHSAFIFTIIAESIGAVFLFNYFRHHDYTVLNALWYSVFHSISAFCTAGYALWPNGLENFVDSKTINIVISCLTLAGSMGFIVVTDVFNFIRRKTLSISLTTKMIVIATFLLVAFGTMILFVTSPGLTIWEACFLSISTITTAGFHTVNVGLLSSCSLLAMIMLMSIGGAPSGTAGGMKLTAFFSVVAIMYTRLQLRNRVQVLGRRLPLMRLYAATSTFLLYTMFLLTSIFLLTWTEDLPFLNLVFESAAALSTSGLSTGITPALSVMGKLIIIGTMIIGRIGVLTFGVALLSHDEDEDETAPAKPTEDLAV